MKRDILRAWGKALLVVISMIVVFLVFVGVVINVWNSQFENPDPKEWQYSPPSGVEGY